VAVVGVAVRGLVQGLGLEWERAQEPPERAEYRGRGRGRPWDQLGLGQVEFRGLGLGQLTVLGR
jgi:hypothetical protein